MARRSPGGVVVDTRRNSPVFALRFRAYGARQYVTLGSADEVWSRTKAEEALRHTLADVERGIWRPPDRQAAAAPAAELPPDPNFHDFASQWFAANKETWRPKTQIDYEWQLSLHLLPFFARHRLSEITVAEVDRYKEAKVRDRRLSPTSINKTITRLGQILDVADERDLIERNPVRVNPRNRRLKVSRPSPIYIDRAGQLRALLDAAGAIDRAARRDRRHVPRRAMLATLAFAGLRLGELLALRWRDVDLSAGRITVRASKTDAGVRQVEMLPALRDELLDLKANARRTEASDLVFAAAAKRTADNPAGDPREHGPSNIRRRVLAPAVERANVLLAELGEVPLPDGLTPHKLRHTAISSWFVAGHELPRVMQMAGHKHAQVTLGIYAHVMLTDEGARDEWRALLGVADRAAMGSSGAFAASAAEVDAAVSGEKVAVSRAF
jgi:integrase